MIVMFELKGIWCVCIYVCVGFQESSLLIICARTAEDYDDDVDKRMTTRIGESSSSFSSCRLSLSLLMLCHSRLDQQADRRRKKRKKYTKGRNLRVIYSSKTYSTFIHASVFVCLRNDVVLSIMLEFSFFFVSPMIGLIRPDFYKHNERETVYRLVGS